MNRLDSPRHTVRGLGLLAAVGLCVIGIVIAGLTLSAAARRAPAAAPGAHRNAIASSNDVALPNAAANAAVRATASGADEHGLVEGTPTLKSAGALAFGPGSVLFVGDTAGAMVHAIDLKDAATDTAVTAIDIPEIDRKIAASLGTTPDDILIRDMKVHRPSQHIYFSVQRGRGATSEPVLLRVSRDGQIQRVALDDVRFASAAIGNAPDAQAKASWGEPLRPLSITDLTFVGQELFVAGLSNAQFASDLRRIAFPFTAQIANTSIEIFHTSHDRYETASPITAFLPITLKGVPTLLAGYGCAPLATFRIDDLKDRAHVRGQTLAELGGGNRPIDMITFARKGKPVVVIANSDRTLMRMTIEDLEKAQPLTKGVDDAYLSAGAAYVPLSIVGVIQLDDLNADHAIVLKRDITRGTLDLKSLPKKWL